MDENSNSSYTGLFDILAEFDGPGGSYYGEKEQCSELINRELITVCATCRTEVKDGLCPYCEEKGNLTDKKLKVTKLTLDSLKFGKALGNKLISTGMVSSIKNIEPTNEILFLHAVSSKNLSLGIVLFKTKNIGGETFRQTVAQILNEKKCDYAILLCKKYDDNIIKILNFYPRVRICTFEEAKSNEGLFQNYSNTFQTLEKVKLRTKTFMPLFSENDDIAASIIKSKEIIAKIKQDGKSSTALGNDLENQMKKVLGYLFTALDIESRDNLPELVIFDYRSGFYLVDIKSGQYNISEYRKVKSYAETYYRLTTENSKILEIRGVIVPNILWKDKSAKITSRFAEFVKNYTPFNNSQISITLIDADAILTLAEKKPTMTRNSYTNLVLNMETIFKNKCVTLDDVNKIVDEMQKNSETKEDAISKSLIESRDKLVP